MANTRAETIIVNRREVIYARRKDYGFCRKKPRLHKVENTFKFLGELKEKYADRLKQIVIKTQVEDVRKLLQGFLGFAGLI